MKKVLLFPLLVLFIGFSSCSDDENDDEVMVETAGEISTFENVELKLVDSDTEEYAHGFSVTTGLTYKRSETTSSNVAEIDLSSFANQSFIAFNSPDQDTVFKEFDGAKTTLIQMANVQMTAEEFDTMEDDTLLKDLKVVHDNESQPIDYRGVVLFETAEGKVGAIKINLLNAERISIDVKVIK